MRYLSHMNNLYRVSDKAYKKYLEAWKAGDKATVVEIESSKFKKIGGLINITDIDGFVAEYLLKRFADTKEMEKNLKKKD